MGTAPTVRTAAIATTTIATATITTATGTAASSSAAAAATPPILSTSNILAAFVKGAPSISSSSFSSHVSRFVASVAPTSSPIASSGIVAAAPPVHRRSTAASSTPGIIPSATTASFVAARPSPVAAIVVVGGSIPWGSVRAPPVARSLVPASSRVGQPIKGSALHVSTLLLLRGWRGGRSLVRPASRGKWLIRVLPPLPAALGGVVLLGGVGGPRLFVGGGGVDFAVRSECPCHGEGILRFVGFE